MTAEQYLARDADRMLRLVMSLFKDAPPEGAESDSRRHLEPASAWGTSRAGEIEAPLPGPCQYNDAA